MDPKPPSPSEHATGDAEAIVEEYGPLAVRRLRKDDGRHLIAYDRAAPSLENEDPAPGR
jgi:hypothetical protein